MHEPNTRPGASRSALQTAAWIAIVTGVIEVLLVLYRKHHDGEFTNRPRDLYWLTPTAYLLLFLAPTALLVLVGRWWRRLPVLWLTLFGTSTASIAALLSTHFGVRFHPAGLLLLAVGGGVQMARAGAAPSSPFPHRAQRMLPWMVVLLACTAAGMLGHRAWRERQAVAALPAAPRDAPNVLLLILDTVRAASLSVYGYARPTTPALDRLGRTGVVFDRAYSTAPWTLPSHASVFTGRWPHEQTTSWFRPLDKRDSTIAEALGARGYLTGGFVANLIYTDYEKGLGRGFQRYVDHPLSFAGLLRSATLSRRLSDARSLRPFIGTDQLLGRRHASDINTAFLEWEGRRGGRPFFAFLNYFDAHDPYLPPADWFQRIAGYHRPNNVSPLRRRSLSSRRPQPLRPEDALLEQDAYDAAIAWLDDEVGRLLDELDRRGTLRNTIVIVTSDHGEEFGEHGLYLHGHTLYRNAVHVPLLFWAPGRLPEMVRPDQPASLRDLPATILSLATGQDNTTFPGASLERFWRNGPPGNEPPVLVEVQQAVRVPYAYPAATGKLRGLVDATYNFIMHPDSAHHLYDWASDPQERNNLYLTADGRRLSEGYLARLKALDDFPSPRAKVEFP